MKLDDLDCVSREYIERSIAIRSRQIANATGHGVSREDAAQAMFLAVIKALPRFDPGRASVRTFASRVVSGESRSITRRFFAGKNRIIRFAKPIEERDGNPS